MTISTMKLFFALSMLSTLVSAAIEAPLRKRHLGMKKDDKDDKDDKSKNKVENEYDFLFYAIMEANCLAVPLEQSL